MKVRVIGRNRPFFDGKLRKIGEVIELSKEQGESLASWMQPVRRKKTPQVSDQLDQGV